MKNLIAALVFLILFLPYLVLSFFDTSAGSIGLSVW
jgi:hypothetical protein